MTTSIEITKSFTFEAAHHFEHMPEGHGYQRMHGHSYQVEVTITGAPDPATGWIADFGMVKEALEGVREALDHRMLNEIDGLENPSLENIAVWVAGQLRPAFPGTSRVSVSRPSCGESCTYRLAA